LVEELSKTETGRDTLDSWLQVLNELEKIDLEKLTWEKFNSLSQTIISKFSENSENGDGDIHSISNLALLSQPHNAALNNAVFEVKRREIIKLDKLGSYTPLCTRRVFLKYYNDKPSTQQYYFWTVDDRKNYLNEIKKVLGNYLPKEVEILL